jgi:Xaa-Pro aminopeptidase
MHKILIIGLFLSLASLEIISAQATGNYPTDYLSPEFHAGRRAAFREKMSENTVAIFFAAQVRLRNNDVDYQYAQSKNFYYFTGLEEPNSMLILFKSPTTLLGKTGTDFIFVQNRDPLKEMWTGKILGVDGVKEKYKLENVFTSTQFNASVFNLKQYDSVLSLFRTEDIFETYTRSPNELARMAAIVDSSIKENKQPIAARNTMQIMTTLRGVKEPEEISLLEKASIMSCEGHNEVMRAVKPGMKEYQAQAIMEYFFKKNGSEYPGYPSINGAAENACVLHYISNLRTMQSGDLLLSDCAAEYHGYTADITRTIPVNGKFSPEQKLIYELVLAAQDSAIAVCKPGTPFSSIDETARRVVNRGLIKLGIAANDAAARTYFPHGTSHHLGLDVHDLGLRGKNPLVAGNFVTVEPGIYIPPGSKCDQKWWNIGVRIEDDILITKDGNRNLSESSPRTVAQIEKMAKQQSVFSK